MTTEAAAISDYDLGHRYTLSESQPGITLRYERAATLSDGVLDDAVELLRRAFNGGPSWFALPVDPREHLRWKSVDVGGDGIFNLVEDDSKLVGVYIDIRHRFLVQGREALNATGYDYAFAPEYQGRRLGTAWSDLSRTHAQYWDAGFSIGYAMHPTSRARRGATYPGTQFFGNQLASFVRPLGLRRILAARRARTRVGISGVGRTRAMLEKDGRSKRPGLNPEYVALGASLLRQLMPHRPDPRPSDLRIRTVGAFDERINQFWDQASTAFDLIQVRDREYLNWRHCDPRSGPQTVRLAEVGDEVVGYSVLRYAEPGLVIDDLLVAPGHEDVTSALVADSLGFGRTAGAAYVRALLPSHHPYRRALARHAFTSYPSPTLLNFMPRQLPGEKLDFLRSPTARIHLMNADSDHR